MQTLRLPCLLDGYQMCGEICPRPLARDKYVLAYHAPALCLIEKCESLCACGRHRDHKTRQLACSELCIK